MTETTPFTVDTDDEFLPDISDALLRDDSEEPAAQESSCCTRLRRRAARPLSVQSGDIIRPSQRGESVEVPKSGFYNFIFPILHKIVRVFLFRERMPLAVYFVLAFFICTFAMWVAVTIVPLRPSVNLSIQSFQIPGDKASIHWDGYQAARAGHVSHKNISTNVGKNLEKSSYQPSSSRLKSTSEDCPINSNTQSNIHSSWLLDIVFKAPEGETLLTAERIDHMHTIEEHIYNDPHYTDFCHKTNGVCEPVSSLLTYLYPRYKNNGSYIYPANGGLVPDFWGTLVNLSTSSVREQALWYTGGRIGANYTVGLLRAQVRIGVPLPCYQSIYDSRQESEQHKKATKFLISLTPYLEKSSKKGVEVLYGGTDVFDHEVNQAIIHDLILALVSLSLVVTVVFVLTGFSPFILIAAILIIISSFPLAYLVYRLLQYETLSILSLISPFVIIGIGVDDVFVFLNTFKHTRQLRGLDTVHKRLTHTIIVAGKATFFTSLTTSVAFFANAISSIPAVKQFGVFMGLIVLMCFVQVFLFMPFVLYLWDRYFLVCENFIFKLLLRLTCLKPRTRYSTSLPAVRFRDLVEDNDSGIDILEQGNGSVESENSSTASGGSGTSESDSNSNLAMYESGSKPVAEEDTNVRDRDDMQPLQLEWPVDASTAHTTAAATTSVDDDNNMVQTVENKATELTQTFLLKYLARPVMILHLWMPALASLRSCVRCVLRAVASLCFIWLFLCLVGIFFSRIWFLKLTDQPPQFFDPDSNLQKMLDLAGNLTDARDINCWDCSAWYNPDAVTPPPSTAPPPTHLTDPPTSATTSRPTAATTQHTAATTPPTEPPPHTTKPPAHTDATTKPGTQPPSTTATTTPTTPPTTQPDSHSTTVPDTSPPTGSTAAPTQTTQPTSDPITSSKLTPNVKVYLVFGIKGVERTYSTSHVLPAEGEGNLAVLDPAFKENFSCPRKTSAPLSGTIRALCRLCRNIIDPDNGLVLNRNAQCFPSTSQFSSWLRCWDVSDLSGCEDVLSLDGNVALDLKIDRDESGRQSLRYYAMGFLSTTSPSASPFNNHNDYLRWEDFISSEMAEIRKQSGPGELYEGAYDVLSSAYQASEHWVQINTELMAINGSIYGIVISCILCLFVVVVLSHNWRLVVSMALTIVGIIITLLGLFEILGWRLGIVEAVSLSILVGNSLDYCIHLTEGYMSADSRHFGFLDRFKFAAGANVRVKRVLSAMSFIGVSIISSAITTILATFPMLGTQIQLFTRFGEILLLDTFVAIVYTLVFCSNFLGFIGPVNSKHKTLNAVLTITATLAGYGVFFMVLYGISTRVNIPSPSGGLLFG